MYSPKYIFISGGVISGIGKGVIASSLGILLKQRGYKVGVIKCETYLNIDSGTINPIEHGDPFLCEDGLEADMDLGTYERFLNQDMSRKNFTTMGQVYETIIKKERSMGYNGKTVDAIPEIPLEIIRRIKNAAKGNDITLVELGGTAGEYQNVFNYEAARMMKLENPEDVIHVHASYIILPSHLGEPKTKPTQLSMRFLNMAGIQPEFIVLRSEVPIDEKRKEKIAVQCNLSKDRMILNPDVSSIYEIPEIFMDQDFDKKVLKYFGMRVNPIKFKDWSNLVARSKKKFTKTVTIAIAGKYLSTGDFVLEDSYNSLIHSIKDAALFNELNVEIKFINTEEIEKEGAEKHLKSMDGIIVPIGWGNRGAEGKIFSSQYAREQKIPYLGLCFGMQLAAVDFARNVAGLDDSNTEENNSKVTHKIIHSIPFDPKYQVIKGEGTSMRLGSYECVIKSGTLAHKIYSKYKIGSKLKNGDLVVTERHRHRFEFNNEYREVLEEHGLVFSGTSPDDFFVEVIELSEKEHPFFLATQAHPEYKSRPLNPHPFFIEFLKAAAK